MDIYDRDNIKIPTNIILGIRKSEAPLKVYLMLNGLDVKNHRYIPIFAHSEELTIDRIKHENLFYIPMHLIDCMTPTDTSFLYFPDSKSVFRFSHFAMSVFRRTERMMNG